jgi:hypothetical protein
MADIRQRLLRPDSVEDVLGTLPALDEIAAQPNSAKGSGGRATSSIRVHAGVDYRQQSRESTSLSWVGTRSPVCARRMNGRCASARIGWRLKSSRLRFLASAVPYDVIRNWRHGIGLCRVGDDSTVRWLESRLGAGLPPSVRFWLKRIRKGAERRWAEVTSKWPEPWYARPGHLERFSGVIRGENGEEAVLTGPLWLMPAEAPGGRSD